jgi:hypothetical protein
VGEAEALLEPLTVVLGVPMGVLLGDSVAEPDFEGEAPELSVEVDEAGGEGVPVGVADLDGERLPVTVGEALAVPPVLREPEGDMLGVGVADGVAPPAVGEADLVLELLGVGVVLVEGVRVPVGEAPALIVAVAEGEASTMPCTKMGDAYMVPALVTGFHWTTVKLPGVTPAHTLTTPRRP